MIGLLFTLSLLIISIWMYISLRWSGKKTLVEFSKLQRGPEPQPFGNALVIFKDGLFEGLQKLKDEFSLPCNFWIWNDYYYITDCPHEVKTVLMNTKNSFEKPPIYNDVVKLVMLQTLPVFPLKSIEIWKIERKILGKAFQPSIWHKYTPVFHLKSLKLAAQLENSKSFNTMYKIICRTGSELFLENFMDIEIKDDNSEQELLLALTEVNILFDRLLDDFVQRPAINKLIPYWFYKMFSKEGKYMRNRMKFIRNRFEYLIDEKRKIFSKNKEFKAEANRLKLVESLLLREDIISSTSDIYRQLMLIHSTSIDTSGLSLAYTLILLGMHQQEQDKVYQEIIEKLGPDKEISTADLSSLKYLEYCINESIRLYPVLPLAGRHISEDLRIGTKVLPKGANVLISPYLLHKNRKYWKNPDDFDPSRFSPENFKNVPLGAFIPFLIGPRDCIGRYYSMMQVKIIAANILRQLRVEVEPEFFSQMKFNYHLVIKPRENFPVAFIPRNRQNFSTNC